MCHISEPVSAKGGLLVKAFKGKGSPKDPSSYRGLLISNHLSKILHSAIREPLLPFFSAHALPMQLGGRRNSTVGMAGHLARLFLSWCRRASITSGILFLDIQTAFYRVVRPLICRYGSFHDQLRSIIQFFDLEPELFQDVCQSLDESSAMAEFGVPPHLEAMCAEIHASTWFSTEGRSELVRTCGGTRPGSPCADLVFNMLFSKVMHKLRDSLYAQGLLCDFDWSGARSLFPDSPLPDKIETLFDIIWADDLAVLFVSPDGTSAPARAKVIARELIDFCLRYGLKPNFGRGKTELLLTVRGRGSVSVRRDLFEHPDPQLEVPSQYLPNCKIRLITQYRHLGGRLVLAAKDKPGVGQSRAVYNKYRNKLFQSSQIKLDTRVQLMEPFVLAIVQFGMGTWTSFRECDIRSANGRLMNMYRGLLRPNFPRDVLMCMSHDEIITRVQLPTLDILIHINRLRHFSHILRFGPSMLWALVEHERTWIELCRQSFRWLFEQLRSTIPLSCPDDDWTTWAQFIQTEPKRWKGYLKRAQKHATLQIGLQWSTKYWHSYILELTSAFNGVTPWGAPTVSTLEAFHICAPCQMRFKNRSAWSVHAFKKHNRICFLRQFSNKAICEKCCVNYWTPARLVQHLQYSHECALFMIQHAEIAPPVPGINSRTFNKQHNPALCPPVATAVAISEVHRPSLIDPESEPWTPLTEQLVDILLSDLQQEEDFTLIGAMMSQVRRFRSALQSCPISFDQILLTWKAFCRDWTQVDFADRDVLTSVWKKIMDVVDVALCPSWLVPCNEQSHFLSERFAPYFWLLDQESFPEMCHLEKPIPRSPFRERFVIHVFSGHRRKGDLQEALESLVLPDQALLHVVSLDVVFGEDGNLFNRQTRTRWINLFRDRMVLAFFAGPPCESWSGARFENLNRCVFVRFAPQALLGDLCRWAWRSSPKLRWVTCWCSLCWFWWSFNLAVDSLAVWNIHLPLVKDTNRQSGRRRCGTFWKHLACSVLKFSKVCLAHLPRSQRCLPSQLRRDPFVTSLETASPVQVYLKIAQLDDYVMDNLPLLVSNNIPHLCVLPSRCASKSGIAVFPLVLSWFQRMPVNSLLLSSLVLMLWWGLTFAHRRQE